MATLPSIKLPVTWSLPDVGITFNTGTPDVTGCQYYVTDPDDGWTGPPAPEPLLTNMPFAPGAYRAPNYFAPRVITLTGYIIAPSAVARRAGEQALSAAFMSTGKTRLMCGQEDQNLYAYVEGSARTVLHQVRNDLSSFSLQLVANDPRKYALDTLSTGQTGLPMTTGGLDWQSQSGLNWTNGLVWGTIVSSGTFNLSNPGTAPSWPTFTVSALGNVLNAPGITIAINNTVLQYTGILNANDVLTIVTDPQQRSVTIGGADRRVFLTTAQWSPVSGNSTVTVVFSASNYTSTAILAGSLAPAYW